jgi:hypothetical protein
MSQARNLMKQIGINAQHAMCFHAGFLLGLLFGPENGSDRFLLNVSWLSTDYTALGLHVYLAMFESCSNGNVTSASQ